MTTQTETKVIETTEITMDQFNDTKGVARGGRGPSGEVAVIRKLQVGKGVSFPRSGFADDKERIRLANRIMSDASKNEYFVRTKRADDGSLLVMRVTKSQSAQSGD